MVAAIIAFGAAPPAGDTSRHCTHAGMLLCAPRVMLTPFFKSPGHSAGGASAGLGGEPDGVGVESCGTGSLAQPQTLRSPSEVRCRTDTAPHLHAQTPVRSDAWRSHVAPIPMLPTPLHMPRHFTRGGSPHLQTGRLRLNDQANCHVLGRKLATAKRVGDLRQTPVDMRFLSAKFLPFAPGPSSCSWQR